MNRRTVVPQDQQALFAVESEQPLPTANDLTRAWCEGYSRSREGRTPHPNVVKRVGRVAKNIAGDCTSIDDWRDAWRASFAAGKRGLWDITAALIDENPRGLHAVKPTAEQAVIARLQASVVSSQGNGLALP